MTKLVRSHAELDVYRKAFDVAMAIFKHSEGYPKHERYSLTDQVRRSSRSVCANLAEAWRKRRYRNAFVCKLNDSEGEAAESQAWIEFSVSCGYLPRDIAAPLYKTYDEIIAMLVTMINHPDRWLLTSK